VPWPINKVGFAVQLCTLRWRGHFLRDTHEMPTAVLETITSQLGLLPIPIDTYPQNEKTRSSIWNVFVSICISCAAMTPSEAVYSST